MGVSVIGFRAAGKGGALLHPQRCGVKGGFVPRTQRSVRRAVPTPFMPMHAGIQARRAVCDSALGSRLRGNERGKVRLPVPARRKRRVMKISKSILTA